MKAFLALSVALLLLPAAASVQATAQSISDVGRDPVAVAGVQYITGSGFGNSQGNSTLLLRDQCEHVTRALLFGFLALL